MEVWPYLRKRELQRLYNTNYNTGMAFRPGCPPNQDTQAFSAPSSTGATSYRAATLGTCAVLSGFKKKKKGLRSRHRRRFPRSQEAQQGTGSPRPGDPGAPAGQSVSGGLLLLTGCFWDNGHLYQADRASPAPGLRCLNWLDVRSRSASAPESGECPPRAGARAGTGAAAVGRAQDAFSPFPGAGNHSYCRNPDLDPRGPWCYVSGEAGAPEKRPCEDLRCPGSHPGPRAQGCRRAAAPAPRTCVRVTPAARRPRALRLVRTVSRPRGPKPIGRRRSGELLLRERPVNNPRRRRPAARLPREPRGRGAPGTGHPANVC